MSLGYSGFNTKKSQNGLFAYFLIVLKTKNIKYSLECQSINPDSGLF